MSSVVGIELIENSSNVVRFILLRSDAMLIPRFYKRGDLIAKDRDKDEQKNDTVPQNVWKPLDCRYWKYSRT